MAHFFLVSALCVAALASAQPPVPSEKDTRTPAQQKINSQLLYEIYRARGEAERKGVPPGPTGVDLDTRRRALVDVRAPVTTSLQRRIRALGGTILSVSERDHSTIARVPILQLETLAAEQAVRFIEPAATAVTNRRPDGGV